MEFISYIIFPMCVFFQRELNLLDSLEMNLYHFHRKKNIFYINKNIKDNFWNKITGEKKYEVSFIYRPHTQGWIMLNVPLRFILYSKSLISF